MFINNRKKKLRNRVIIAAACVFVMTLGIWLNYTNNEDTTTEDVANQIVVGEAEKEETNIKEKDKEENNVAEPDDNNVPTTYLIKEEDGVVKVYLRNNGKEELYLITSIPFDLLSESDQIMFQEGVILDTEDDLGRFLENFDS